MTDDHRTLKQRMALSLLPGLTQAAAKAAVEVTKGLDNFFAASTDSLMQLIGSGARAYTERAREKAMKTAEGNLGFMIDHHVRCLWCEDDDYPGRLRSCPDAPAMLYALGSCNFDAPHMVGIVGTRACSQYGLAITRRIVTDLAKLLPDVVVVSGLAHGIDVAAHRAALEVGVKTVGVVAHGLDKVYPAEHRDTAARMVRAGGAIVTEYQPGTPMHRSNFLARNRIVAALSDVLIVVESGEIGGSLSTARQASLYGRTVIAVPGRLTDDTSRGTNHLIATDSARIYTDALGLLRVMNWEPPAPCVEESPRLFTPLTPEQQQIVDFLAQHSPATPHDVAHALGISFSVASERLFMMEISGIIGQYPGGGYTKI